MKVNRRAIPAFLGLALLFAAATQKAHAITITIEYTDEGDTPPHPENPTWDPAGVILKAHFAEAKRIWESLLPGEGDYEFDFHWDDNISGLALHTTGLDEFIEVNPNFNWYADADFLTDNDFNFTQTLYSGLPSASQAAWFSGTPPPTMLEVGFVGMGNATPSQSGQSGVTSANGFDLLTVILHEMGHALGISDTEPGDYNINPQHIGGGLNNVLVNEAEDDDFLESHLAGSGNAPWLMDSATPSGTRELPSATDVLVIAEDQGISSVQLARISRISTGQWSDTNGWIGGAVPYFAQDVSIGHGGNVAIDVDASARNLVIAPGNTVFTLFNSGIAVAGTLTFTGATVEFVSTNTLVANHIIGDPGELTTGPGSLVRFNQFTRGTSAATSATFGGSVAIGADLDPSPMSSSTTFDPNFLATWNIGQDLIVGDQSFAALVVDNGAWTVGGNVTLGSTVGLGTGSLSIENSAMVTVGGNLTVGANSGVVVDDDGALDVAGAVFIAKSGQVTYKSDRGAGDAAYDIRGGDTVVFAPPMGAPTLLRSSGGSLTFEETSNAGDASIILEGGAGDGGLGAKVTFRGNTVAGDIPPLMTPPTAAKAQFRTKGGRRGPTLSAGFDVAGNGGQVRFENTSTASDALFVNEGGAEYFGGAGGHTVFTGNSSADHGTFHNHGATYINAGGGATQFFDNSTAASATITNHADGTYNPFDTLGATAFFDSSDAGNATIENEGSPNQTNSPGRSEFRGHSSAALSNIHNRTHLTPGGLAGRTIFFDTATAADATIHTYEGYSDAGRIEFHDDSTAARARLIIENVPNILGSSGNGGHITFHDNATAAQSQIFLKENACCNGVQFYNNSRANDAQFLQEDGSGNIVFWNNARADFATFSVGERAGITFYDHTNAEDAVFTLANQARLSFVNNASAGRAQIVAAGGSVYTAGSQAMISFISNTTAADASITVNGSTAPLASPATLSFSGGASPGNATLTANGGSGGGTGTTIVFNGAANGSTARLIANAGGLIDFFDQRTYNDISFGSIEGAGTFALRGAHVTTGSRNTSTTVAGKIVDNPPGLSTGGRLTKVGAGTLTLAGANTYSGLTTINGGTVSVTGSIAGGAIVNNGGTLNGTGTIVGGVTINSGGVFAPGLSPGAITVDGFTMTPGSALNFELGAPLRDHIVLTSNGNVSLAGTLNLALVGGFTPAFGQSFPLFEGAIGSITGAFSTFNAPIVNGLTFELVQNANSVMLQVVGSAFAAADFNRDGAVSGADLTNWKSGFGAAGATQTQGDADGDADVDGRDFLIWQRQLGGGSPIVAQDYAVPEPGTLVPAAASLLSLAGAAKARRRPRRDAEHSLHDGIRQTT